MAVPHLDIRIFLGLNPNISIELAEFTITRVIEGIGRQGKLR